jgi:hypothetical protein
MTEAGAFEWPAHAANHMLAIELARTSAAAKFVATLDSLTPCLPTDSL